jgi:hypothetical protein
MERNWMVLLGAGFLAVNLLLKPPAPAPLNPGGAGGAPAQPAANQ